MATESGFAINGKLLRSGFGGHDAVNGALPSDHDITYTPVTLQETVGGTIVLEPPSGLKRVHVWYYNDFRSAATVQFLKNLIGTSGICTIDTYDIGKDTKGVTTLLRNVKVSVQMPVFKTLDGNRDLVEPFSISFQELYSQS